MSYAHALAWLSLAAGGLSAAIVIVDLCRRPQPMAIMNLVWPLTATFGTVPLLAFYLWRGRAPLRGRRPTSGDTPMPIAVATGALHCGAGCALGDVFAELLLLAAPGLAGALGLGVLFHDRVVAAWILDFGFALAFGIAFQFFALPLPRRGKLLVGLAAAAKADALSLTAWQVGMYGGMAPGLFVVGPHLLGGRPTAAEPEFWWFMQGAMLVGFATSYPVNWWLIRRGVKTPM
ncbi:MAG TPA: DUF4396 domain-containing protein [Caulobacteraceae bacterium]